MKKLWTFLITFLISTVASLDNDVDDLTLNYNQIKRLTGSFNSANLVKAVNFAVDSSQRSRNHENILSNKAKVIKGTISYAQLIESLPDEHAKEVDLIARDMASASSYLLNMYCKSTNIANKDCVKFMSNYSPPESSKLGTTCPAMQSMYKSYRRFLPASYKDGIQRVRTSVSGNDLPLARYISKVLFSSGTDELRRKSEYKEPSNQKLSLSVAQWTQFIEHDLSKAVARSLKNGNAIECCDQDSMPIQPRYLHDSCLPILIPSDDSVYRHLRVTCINYVRSALAINEQCRFGVINQLNQATNKLDLSQVYGSDRTVETKLRSFHQGMLKASPGEDFSLSTTTEDLCFMPNENSTCYKSGDSRVNVNPLVTSLYTLFLRSHNKIASKLRQMNPTWKDEQLFNITKDINIAIYQKFIYNDWANAVLGKQMAMEIRNKNDDHDGKHYKSDKVSNEFGTAAIKFYNTMLPGDLLSNQDEPVRNTTRSISENIIEAAGVVNMKKKEILKLRSSFYLPRDFGKNHFLDQIMNAALRQHTMEFDNSYVEDLSSQLYRSKMQNNKVFGSDSLAFDIQRSRDHGLQPYINYIKKCFNIRITQWDDLRSILNEDDLNKLKSLYESVKDVDLIVGGLSEIVRENSAVGQTFACILNDQLISSKISDEKFYTKRNDATGEKILKTVENYSAARFICDNTKLRKVQGNIFQIPSDENPLVDCSDYERLPKLDLSYWLIQTQA